MYYAWNITLTKGNSDVTPEKTVFKLEDGVIVRCEVAFPSGCSGLVFCHINRSVHQVYPKNPDYQFTGNGETVITSDEFAISDEPHQLEFYGWNTDEVYDHTITVRIQIVPKREITRLALAEMLRFMSMEKPGGV
jgi:hypothetical protein